MLSSLVLLLAWLPLDDPAPTLAASGTTARFHDSGADFALQGHERALRLELRALVRGEARRVLEDAPARVRDGRVELQREGLLEWFVARDEGIEQGFTLARRPLSAGTGALCLELAVEGATPLAVSADGRGALLAQAGGERVWTYSGLVAYDADGRDLDARMSVDAHSIRLHVDDAGARFPIVVDPVLAVQEAKLTASDADSLDTFGAAIAADGQCIVVGAPGEDSGGSVSGAAYVFRRNALGWSQEAKLVPSDAGSGDRAGSSVAISDGVIVVGARGKGAPGASQAGAAFVWTLTQGSWVQSATLRADDLATDDALGTSVAISRGLIAAGAPLHDGLGNNSGAVYLFARVGNQWTQIQKLVGSDTSADDGFGSSLAVEGTTVAVGALGDDDLGASSGSVYVFERSGGTWVQDAKLTASDGQNVDQFGISVGLTEDVLVVGSWGDDDNGPNAGSAYVFSRGANGFVEQQKLVPQNPAANDLFGLRVGAAGERVIIGAVGGAGNASDAGSAHVFERDAGSWTEVATLAAADGADGDSFGTVAMSGNLVAVGAHRDQDAGHETGAAYVFRLREPLGSSYCTSTPNSTGAAARISARGAPALADEDLELTARFLPAGVSGLLFLGPEAVQVPFGDGFRCVADGSGPVRFRRVQPVATANAAGVARRQLDFDAPYASYLIAGARLRFQFWYRDLAAGGAGFNLTDGVQLILR